MIEDIYFIHQIVAAYRDTQRRRALIDAFAEIRRLGREPGYRLGLAQFRAWMQVVAGAAEFHHAEDWPRGSSGRLPQRDIGFRLLAEERCVAEFSIPCSGGKADIRGLSPATYSLFFETGRLLWKAALTAEDLHPPVPLDVAAADGRVKRTPSREFSLFDRSLMVRVYGGLETGFMEIEFRGFERRPA